MWIPSVLRRTEENETDNSPWTEVSTDRKNGRAEMSQNSCLQGTRTLLQIAE